MLEYAPMTAYVGRAGARAFVGGAASLLAAAMFLVSAAAQAQWGIFGGSGHDNIEERPFALTIDHAGTISNITMDVQMTIMRYWANYDRTRIGNARALQTGSSVQASMQYHNVHANGRVYFGWQDATPFNANPSQVNITRRGGGLLGYGDRARVVFRPGAAVKRGVVTVLVDAFGFGSNAHNRGPTDTLMGFVTVGRYTTWHPRDRENFQASVLKASIVENRDHHYGTGLRIQRRGAECNRISVFIVDAPNILGLARRDAGDGNLPATIPSSTNLSESLGNLNITRGVNSFEHDLVELMVQGGAVVNQHSVFTATVRVATDASCPYEDENVETDLVYRLTVARAVEWEEQGRERAQSDGPFILDDLRESAVPVNIGTAFHRSSSLCRHIKVSLVNPPSYLQMQIFRSDGAPRGGGAAPFTVRMQRGHGSDRHVGLQFKPRAPGLEAGTLKLTMAAHSADSCTHVSRQDPITLEYAVTVLSRELLTRNAADVTVAAIDRQSLIDASAATTPVSLAFSRKSLSCDEFVLHLHQSAPSYLVLSTVNTAGDGGTARSLTVDTRNDAGYIHVRGSPRISNGWVEAPVVTRPAPSCTDPNVPLPTTIAYALAVTVDSPWLKQGKDVDVSSGPFLAEDLNADSSAALPTGFVFHRSSTFCRYVNVELGSGTPSYIQLQRLGVQGEPTTAPGNSIDGLLMQGGSISDQQVRLQFSENRSAVPAGNLVVNLIASRYDPACPSLGGITLPAEGLTVIYTLTVLAKDEYADGANDTDVAREFTQAELIGASSPTFTGASFQQITDDSCLHVDAALAADAQEAFVLAVAGRDPAGSLAGVEQNDASADYNISLMFRSGARVAVGEREVDIVVRPAASCAAINVPDSVTVSYRVTVNASAPSIALNRGQGYLIAGSTLRHTEITISVMDPGPVGGGTAHPNLSIASDDSGLFAIIDAPGSRDYDLKVAQLVLRPGLAVSDTVVAYTVTVAGSDSGIAALTTAALPVTINVVIPPERVAASDAGAYATRLIGLGIMDSVLKRPHASSSASASAGLLEMLAAKESGLESGEIDLREFLDGQSFAMPLQVAQGSFIERAGFWGHAEGYSVGGESDAQVVYDGSVFSTNVGADMLLNNGVLAGFSYGVHDFDSTYSSPLASGGYNLELDIMHPYAAVDVDGGWLAVAVGIGKGELDLNRTSGPLHLHPRTGDGRPGGTREAEYLGYAIGYSRDLSDALRVRGSGASSDLKVAEEAGESSLDVESGALRLALAYTSQEHLMGAFPLLPMVELAYAGYWGDAPSDDSSFIIAAGAKYAGEGPTTLSGTYRYAATGDSQSGLEVNLRIEPSRGGLGLGLGFSPSWGLEGDGADLIAEITNPQPLAARGGVHGVRAKADLSYGLAVRGGLLTPYGSWSLAGDDELGVRVRSGADRAWLLGWRPGGGDELKIEYRLGD